MKEVQKGGDVSRPVATPVARNVSCKPPRFFGFKIWVFRHILLDCRDNLSQSYNSGRKIVYWGLLLPM